ncbi:hypothetical protein CLF_110796 [Clonorchis sinensis]|uniref:Uncharacterized protein n=1 Tax=Clonorchis sinensis TaxID=79923 RepID=G7YL65_CLOSI|nr:hypothetical protein CLF_110796 [Clonorchis sinensis]
MANEFHSQCRSGLCAYTKETISDDWDSVIINITPSSKFKIKRECTQSSCEARYYGIHLKDEVTTCVLKHVPNHVGLLKICMTIGLRTCFKETELYKLLREKMLGFPKRKVFTVDSDTINGKYQSKTVLQPRNGRHICDNRTGDTSLWELDHFWTRRLTQVVRLMYIYGQFRFTWKTRQYTLYRTHNKLLSSPPCVSSGPMYDKADGMVYKELLNVQGWLVAENTGLGEVVAAYVEWTYFEVDQWY